MLLIHRLLSSVHSYIVVLSSLLRLAPDDWFRSDVLVERGIVLEPPYTVSDEMFDPDDFVAA